MSRPKEFDRDQALQNAIGVFCEKGYAAASTDELMRAMKISGKACMTPLATSGGSTWRRSGATLPTALTNRSATWRNHFLRLLESRRCCLHSPQGSNGIGLLVAMGINAICEFGRSDPQVTSLRDTESTRLTAALEQALRQAKSKKEISRTLKESAAAQFLRATLSGMKVAAKAGTDAKTLKTIAQFALRSLTNPQ